MQLGRSNPSFANVCKRLEMQGQASFQTLPCFLIWDQISFCNAGQGPRAEQFFRNVCVGCECLPLGVSIRGMKKNREKRVQKSLLAISDCRRGGVRLWEVGIAHISAQRTKWADWLAPILTETYSDKNIIHFGRGGSVLEVDFVWVSSSSDLRRGPKVRALAPRKPNEECVFWDYNDGAFPPSDLHSCKKILECTDHNKSIRVTETETGMFEALQFLIAYRHLCLSRQTFLAK